MRRAHAVGRSVGPLEAHTRRAGSQKLGCDVPLVPPAVNGRRAGVVGRGDAANLDVKRETQRASAGAHRVACFESPSHSLLHPTLAWPSSPDPLWGHPHRDG